MQKPAPTDHELNPLIRDRWSPVAFDPAPLDPEDVRRCLAAARWAASSFNEQPWTFVVGLKDREPETWQGVLDCLVPANAAWARHAPLLAISVAKSHFTKNDKPNRHAWHDVGLATAQLVLQATDLGLFAHAMAGFSVEEARKRFAIPESHEPVAALAIGRPGDGHLLDADVRKRDDGPRSRKPLGEIVVGGRWGSAPAWL